MSRLHNKGLTQKVLRRHALEHHGSSGFQFDAVRYFNKPVSRQNALFGIGTGRRCISNPIANLEVFDARADSHDNARTLVAGRKRHLRCLVKPSAEINVDEVQPNGLMAHFGFTCSRLTDLDLFILQDFRTAGLVNPNSVDHGFLSLSSSLQQPVQPR